MEKYSVDRVEEEYVVLEKDGEAFEELISVFNFEIKEGMIISKDDLGNYIYEIEETENLKKELFDMQNSLFCN